MHMLAEEFECRTYLLDERVILLKNGQSTKVVTSAWSLPEDLYIEEACLHAIQIWLIPMHPCVAMQLWTCTVPELLADYIALAHLKPDRYDVLLDGVRRLLLRQFFVCLGHGIVDRIGFMMPADACTASVWRSAWIRW